MAVVPMWKCDRDGMMFTSKREADDYDKMLETGEALSAALCKAVPAVSEEHAVEIGLFLSRHRDVVIKALKGSPDALEELFTADAEAAQGGAQGLRAVN